MAGHTTSFAKRCDLANEDVLRPVIDRVLPLSEIREGHRILEEHDHFGKVVMRIGEES